MILTLSLLTIVIANPQQAKAWDPIYDPIWETSDEPLDHMKDNVTITNGMYMGTYADFTISNIIVTTQYPIFEAFMNIYDDALITYISLRFIDEDNVTLDTWLYSSVDDDFIVNVKHIVELPPNTEKMIVYVRTSRTTYDYEFSMTKQAFIQDSFIKNQTYIETLSYAGLFNAGYNTGYSQGVNDSQFQYWDAFNNGSNWAKEEIYNNGIGNLPLPDGTGFYDETLSYDYLLGHTVGYAYAESVIPQDIYDNGIESSYPTFNAMLSHDFISGVAMDDAYAYDQGFIDGGNNSFMAGIEVWIVPAIIIVLIGGGFIAFAKMRNKGD